MKKRQKRKNRKAEARIPFPNLLAAVLVCVAASGLSYVWLCARCNALGNEIKELEKQRRVVRQRAVSEQDRWAQMLAPANLERALKHHQLAMKLPDERQIVRIRNERSDEHAAVAFNL
jgi:hypothetical protein